MYLFPYERFAKDDINHTACIEFAVLHRSCVNHNSDEWGPVRETAVNETQLSCEHHHTDSMEKHNHPALTVGASVWIDQTLRLIFGCQLGVAGGNRKWSCLGKAYEWNHIMPFQGTTLRSIRRINRSKR